METLITGSTSYFSAENLKRIFDEDHIVVVDDNRMIGRKEEGITVYSAKISDLKYEQIFANYNFDRVLFISDHLTMHGVPQAELENLRRVLRLCKKSQTGQIVYLSSIEVCSDVTTGKVIMIQSMEELCRHYREEDWLPLKIIRSPFLVSPVYENDFLCKTFHALEKNQPVNILECQEQKAYFISPTDVAEFLSRLFDNWEEASDEMSLWCCGNSDFGMLGDALKKFKKDVTVNYIREIAPYHLQLWDNPARERFGWFAKLDVVENLDVLYEEYKQRFHVRVDIKKKIHIFVNRYKKVLIPVELVLGSLGVEVINRFLESSVQFRMIDVRLLFIVLMGSIYGINIGLAAALLECVALTLSYMGDGTNWLTLFYEPTNWVPFILYMTIGAVCGYNKFRNENNLSFVKEENRLIREKYQFIRVLYSEVLENKREYKKQIIGSRDSFGKIFEVVNHLDTVVPQQIFSESIKVLEDIMSNHAVAIYTVRRDTAVYGRLEVSSRAVGKKLAKSIRLDDYRIAMNTVQKGEVWTNTGFIEDYPMYIAGIMDEKRVVILILIYHAEYSQIGMYYANLLRIVCGLIQNALLRAWEYQNAIADKMYVPNTQIYKEDYFLELLSVRHSMAEDGIAEFALIQIEAEGMSFSELDQLLRVKIRENDILGAGKDGNLYLILAQIEHRYLEPVLDRLRNQGLKCSVVTQIGNEGKE